MFCVFWDTFLGLLPGAFFFVVLGVFRCDFWLTFGAKGCFRSGLGGIEKIMQKKFGTISGNLGKWGVPYNLWSVAALGHSASWSLVVAKGQRGSGWELVTPCARSAVAD